MVLTTTKKAIQVESRRLREASEPVYDPHFEQWLRQQQEVEAARKRLPNTRTTPRETYGLD